MDISNPTVAIFSTHDLPRIRYNAIDDMLWRNTSWTRYWEKDVWVLPIHRPSNVGHWVLCVIYFSRKELHLFDSLAEWKPWRHDVKVGSC
jgi:Ulp1 family protease